MSEGNGPPGCVTRRRAFAAAGAVGAGGAGALLAACGQSTPAPRSATLSGPVEIALAEWVQSRVPYWEDRFRAVAQEHPEVKGRVELVPFAEFLTKLKAGIAAGTAPDVSYLHSSYVPDLLSLKALHPLTADRVPLATMDREWAGFKEKHYHWENRPYFAAVGQLVPAFFINLDLWQAAGLSDSDIPATWEQLYAVARRVSRRGPDGKLAPAGLATNGAGDLADWMGLMRYQKGVWRFSKDGKKSQTDRAENLQSLEFLLRMWKDDIWTEKHEIAAFERREAVIGYRYSQYANVLRLQQPDLRFKLIPVPTVSGQDLPARVTRGYDPGGPGIPITTQGQKLEAAWLLAKQVWLNQDANAELCRQQSAVPCWAPVLNHKSVKDSAELQTNGKVVPYTVFGGWTNLSSGVENPASLADVFAKSAPPRETLARVAEQETLGLNRNTNLVMERQYAHAARFKE